MSRFCALLWHDLRQVGEPDADGVALFRCRRRRCGVERRLSTVDRSEDGRMWGTDDGTYQL